ncbi:MAG TPA: transcription-repair coupling factor [Candidatus Dormibacteraeota bacterium]|nr:transcription-repair coupling factor [Candidatus Dormibacteraeota bacterium]
MTSPRVSAFRESGFRESGLWKRTISAAPALERWIRGAPSRLDVSRLPKAAWPIIAGAVARAFAAQRRSVLILVPAPERFADELRPWLAGSPPVHVFAEIGISFLDRPPAFDASVNKRLEALSALSQATDEPAVIVSSRRAVTRQTISPQNLVAGTLTLAPDRGPDPIAVALRLVELGYSREPQVEDRGQFSLRGGILDVFPSADDAPVRAEWAGDVVETLRLFDPENQRSVMAVPEAAIRTGRELLLGPARGQAAVALLRGSVSLESLRADVRSDWEDELVRLESGAAFPGVEFYAAYLDPSRPSLLDHLPAGTVVLDFDPERQLADARSLIDEAEMLAAAEAGGGELPRGFTLPTVGIDRLNDFGERSRLQLRAGESTGDAVDLGWTELETLVGRPRAAAGLAALSESATVIFATEQDERLKAFLDESGVSASVAEVDLDLDLELEPALRRADIDITQGASQPEIGFHLATDAELFGRLRRPSRASRGRRTRTQDMTKEFTLDFAPDELVVHVDHGIALFKGMRLIESEGAHREYLELEYAEGDRLFVPVENLDRVQKYLGGEGQPALHRLGTSDWTRARGRARKVVQDVADELLKIYSLREARPGIAFAPDTAWQQELESSFPYEETPDQVAALAEIKADMESDKPMDRLLCGDVGFGKTELALRAAFKAAMSGKQVALLAPTTVLAQQHFHVFRERLAKFPVVVEMLSRFVDDETQARNIEGIKAGQVDIVVGTHRLLQRDVRFKRLGLLIIDEEHRFGVMQKERLKKLRTQLDVLSLSATPIPRTLHMAVGGIRDMSVIQTPPEERQPIKTYVTADEDELVREAITRELQRGGQIYYVHNRVRTIQKAAERIQELVPEARVVIGHGQMGEDELAHVMVDFESAKFDVLVCTTIIESGLDIPNVNTIIVERSDRFGLAQLYQLRGRVGRSGRRAYAYFLYDPRRSLTEQADKRLDVISGLHELGQGFKIALRDLEIRGAGNLLGTEQHGAIAAVGFEMYLQMLQGAVAKMRSGSEESTVGDVLSTAEMNLDLPLDHFIPRSYIRDEKLRLGAYRQLAATEDEEELDSVLRSLEDRYGPGPAQLDNLAYSLRIKLRGQRMGLRGVVAEGHDIVIRVDPQRVLDVDELSRRMAGRIAVAPNRLKMRRQGEGWQRDLLQLLDEMAELYESARVVAVPGS